MIKCWDRHMLVVWVQSTWVPEEGRPCCQSLHRESSEERGDFYFPWFRDPKGDKTGNLLSSQVGELPTASPASLLLALLLETCLIPCIPAFFQERTGWQCTFEDARSSDRLQHHPAEVLVSVCLSNTGFAKFLLDLLHGCKFPVRDFLLDWLFYSLP